MNHYSFLTDPPSRRTGHIAALILLLMQAAAGQSLTLDAAVASAVQNNERVKQFQERTIEKDYANDEAFGYFLPSLRFQGSYNHLNAPMQIDLDPIRQAMIQLQAGTQVSLAALQNPAITAQQKAAVFAQASSQLNNQLPAFVETFKKQDYPSAGFVATQPLFLGGKLIAAKTYASSELGAARAEEQQTKNEVIRDVVNAYLTAALLEEVVQVRRDVLNGMQQHLRDAERLHAEGLIAPHHRLRARVAVADAERNLARDVDRLSLAYVALRSIAGMTPDVPVSVSERLIYFPSNTDLDSLLRSAHSHQPILQFLSEKRIAAAQKFNAERAEFLPQVAAFGKYEIFPQYLSSLEPRWIVGVQVSFPLFTGMQRYNRLQSASHLEDEVAHLEADSRNRIDLWVNKSYREAEDAGTVYRSLETNVQLADENVRVNEKRFQSGLGTSLEVVDAHLGWEKTQLERLSALQQYCLSLMDLSVAVGRPEEFITLWNNGRK